MRTATKPAPTPRDPGDTSPDTPDGDTRDIGDSRRNGPLPVTGTELVVLLAAAGGLLTAGVTLRHIGRRNAAR